MNSGVFENYPWDIRGVKPPWGDRPSIYRHILAHVGPGESSSVEGDEPLPDEDLVRGEARIGWAAGARDGVFGHHVSGDDDGVAAAREVFDALRLLTEKSTDERAEGLYALLTERPALQYAEQLFALVIDNAGLNPERLHAVARWLATNAADREPVKCAIALLGTFPGDEDRDLLLTLGRHEEFTFYTAVALRNAGADYELSLWALACLVNGWGRIQIIERLAGTEDDQIKAWMLRDGYRNEVMDEYTALICARTGDLIGALRRPGPDKKLLRGAGSILSALIRGRGGPSEGIESYPEGAEAAELYLRQLQSRQLDLEDLVAVSVIEQFLKEEDGEARDPALGWPARRATLIKLIASARSQTDWREKIREGLESDDPQAFWTASEAAKALGIDTWEIYFERLRRGEDQWFFVMQTDDPRRIDRVLLLAEKILPLDEIASGPAEELGVGPDYRHHSALDFVLQDLRRFLGKGWPLIRVGLQSPVVRNRNMAVRALAAWNRAEWPEEAETLLKRALAAEPEEETRETMRSVLAGAPLDYSG